MYVILFPQLLVVVHFKQYCNTYGSVASYIIGMFFRIAGGEPLINLQPFIYFPGWNGEEQMFPFRTLAMILSLISVVLFSILSQYLFESGTLPPSWDVLRCVVNIPEDAVRVEEPHEGEMTMVTGFQQVRRYSATDEMNGRVNPALSLGSDSECDEQQTPTARRKPNSKVAASAGATGASPSKRPMLNSTTATAKTTTDTPF